MEQREKPWTMSVPAAGKQYFGLGRNASYRAAKSGLIPTMEIGGLIKALPRVIEAMLSKQPDGEPTSRTARLNARLEGDDAAERDARDTA